MQTALYAEINLLCIIILVMLAWKLWRMDKSVTQRLLVSVILSQALLFLIDFLWVFIDGGSIPRFFNYILNIGYYELTAISPFLWVEFVFIELYGALIKKGKRALLSVPTVLLSAALLLSVFLDESTGVTGVFYIDAENVFHRGDLYFIQPIMGYLYLVYAGYLSVRAAYRAHTYGDRQKAITLTGFVVLPVVSALIQIIFPGIPLICCGTTISIIMIYMNLQEQLVTQDTVTQMNNRFQLMKYLERKLDRLGSDDSDIKDLIVYMMDIDSFKKINDGFGHMEGDRALQLTSDAVKRVCGRHENCFCARFGGDEFSVIFDTNEQEKAEMLCSEIKKAVSEIETGEAYRLSMSVGYTTVERGKPEKAEIVLDRADDMLYEDKKRNKKEMR